MNRAFLPLLVPTRRSPTTSLATTLRSLRSGSSFSLHPSYFPPPPRARLKTGLDRGGQIAMLVGCDGVGGPRILSIGGEAPAAARFSRQVESRLAFRCPRADFLRANHIGLKKEKGSGGPSGLVFESRKDHPRRRCRGVVFSPEPTATVDRGPGVRYELREPKR
jgi:hypothetical protein